MKLSVFLNETRRPERAVDLAVEAERRGLHGAWAPHIMGFDALTVMALIASRTERVRLGTSVVPTWPRHPVAMAQQALTVGALAPGRFRLGVGPSHVPVIRDMHGLEFDKPIRHVREYLEVVRSLVSTGAVGHEGERYRVHIGLELSDERMPVMVSALSEQMLRTAGRHADGVITWLAPAEYVSSTVVPLVRSAAEDAGRPVPPVVAQVPATCSDDRGAVREAVRTHFGIYPMLPFYNAMLRAAGAPGADEALAGGWNDELVDAVVPSGDEAALADRTRAYLDAGADEVAYAPFPAGDDREASLARTMDALAAIAAS